MLLFSKNRRNIKLEDESCLLSTFYLQRNFTLSFTQCDKQNSTRGNYYTVGFLIPTGSLSTLTQYRIQRLMARRVVKDKDKYFPRGQQHWVTVKNGLLADIYQ